MASYWLTCIEALSTALWITLVAVGSGRWLLRLFDLDSELSALEQISFGGALGLAFLSYATFLLGILHLWQAGAFGILLAGLTLFLLAQHSLGIPWSACRQELEVSGTLASLWRLLTLAFLGLFLVAGFFPEIFFDALYYHLAVPNLYCLSHQIYSVPTLLFSNFVLLIQMDYGLATTLGPPISAKLLHVMTSFLLTATVLGFCRRRHAASNGWAAAGLLLMIPIAGLNVTSAGIDVGWTYFTAAGMAALLLALDTFSSKRLLLAGLLMGAAGSCKYPALPLPWLGAVLVGWEAFSQIRNERLTRTEALKRLGIYVLAAAACQIPFALRNLVFHANPIYPFLGKTFGFPRIAETNWRTFLSDSQAPVLSKEFLNLRSIMNYLLRPWFVRLRGPGAGFHLGPLYLLIAPLFVFTPARDTGWKRARIALMGLWLLWMLSNPTPRYGLPVVAILILCAAEFSDTEGIAGNLRAGFLTIALCAGLYNWTTVARYLRETEGWRPLLGREAEADYLARPHFLYPTPPYRALQWMNSHLAEKSKVLFAAEARTYYLNREAIPSSAPDMQPLVRIAAQSTSGEDMAQRLRTLGVTHLFFSAPEAERVKNYRPFDWTDQSWKVFGDFWRQSVALQWSGGIPPRQEQDLFVYELLSEADSHRPHTPPANPFPRNPVSLPSGT